MANLIKSGGGAVELSGNAVASDVLSGKTFYSNDADNKINGTMPNQGSWSTTINAGGSVTIPNGYHNGSGRVSANNVEVGGCYISTYGEVVWNQTADRTLKLSMTCTKGAKYRLTTIMQGFDGHMHDITTTANGTKTTDKKEKGTFGGYFDTRVTRVYEGVVSESSENISISQYIYTKSSQITCSLKFEVNPK